MDRLVNRWIDIDKLDIDKCKVPFSLADSKVCLEGGPASVAGARLGTETSSGGAWRSVPFKSSSR